MRLEEFVKVEKSISNHRSRCHFWIDQIPEQSVDLVEEVLKNICKSCVSNNLNKTLPLPFETGVGESV